MYVTVTVRNNGIVFLQYFYSFHEVCFGSDSALLTGMEERKLHTSARASVIYSLTQLGILFVLNPSKGKNGWIMQEAL